MKVIDIINNSQRPFASFELVPPVKGSDRSALFDNVRELMDFEPPFLNITCHRDEERFVENADGSYKRYLLSRRPSTTAIVGALMREFSVDIVPHVICGGQTKTATESELLDLHFLGVENVVALRGDAMPGQKRFIPERDGFDHADGLVGMIRNLNEGRYLDPTVKDGVHTDFCVGVGAYPEKHFEAANIEEDIKFLKRKVDAGADYIITQMFFNNDVYYRFVGECRKAGITVPVIPGLKPLSGQKQIASIPLSFHLDLPEELVMEVYRAKGDKDKIYDIGQEWCMMQSRDLIAHGAPAIHYYTMGKADNIKNIVKAVF